MTVSMTAFSSKEVLLPIGVAHWELRSVNHRYLELSFKLPETLRDFEFHLRELMRHHLSRGRIDCFLKLDIKEEKSELNIDLQLVEQLVTASEKIAREFSLSPAVSSFDILRWPSVVQPLEKDVSEVKKCLLDSFQLVLEELITARRREGTKLKSCIEERLLKMQDKVNKIEAKLPAIQKAIQTKLYEKIAELKLQRLEGRFEEEIVYLMQKIDVSEELDRLKMHLGEVQRILTEEKIVGRRLDFLMQELNREANTLISKVSDGITVQDSIELKVLIEEIREQVQNLE